MKTTLAFLALPFLSAAPLSAQQGDPSGPGQDLVELFEKMQREGATEDDLRRFLEGRNDQAQQESEAKREHQQHERGQPERPEPEAARWKIGLVVEPVAPFIRQHLGLDGNVGVRVVQVADGSPAARVGIRENDIIFVAGDKRISNLEDLKGAVELAGREGHPIQLGWIHQGERKGAELKPQGPTPVQREKRDERAERAEQRPAAAMMRRMEEMARRMERQQREIEELRREIEKLKRQQQEEE